MEMLQHDRREASEQRQELCDIIARLQREVQSAEEHRDKVNSCRSPFHTTPTVLICLSGIIVIYYQPDFSASVLCVCSWSCSVSSYN